MTTDTFTLDLFAPEDAALPLAEQLHAWQQEGLLRQLDMAWMQFVQAQDPQAAPCLLMASALLAHMEGRGHSCLPLAALLQQPQQLLGWDNQAQAALSAQWQQLPTQLGDWLAAIAASPLVRSMDDDDQGQPMVLAGVGSGQPLLYLRRYWHYERQVASHIQARSQQQDAVDEARAQAWLEQLFPLAPASTTDANTPSCDWQKLACALALRKRLSIITGGPGTGKTYTAARLLALLFGMAEQPEQLRVALAAPTGKAAARLKQSIDQALQDLPASVEQALDLASLVERTGAARTLHSLLGARPDSRQMRHHSGQPLEVDVLIVDEASMVHLEMMAALLDALPPSARLIILGDKDQLASVEAGAVLGDLCQDAQAGHYLPDTAAYALRVAGQKIPQELCSAQGSALAQCTVMLRHSRRFGGPIGQLAQAVNHGQGQLAQQVLDGCTDASLYQAQGKGIERVWRMAVQNQAASYQDYCALLPQYSPQPEQHEHWVRQVLQAFEGFRLLCAVREGDWGVAGLNQAIERLLIEKKWLKKDGPWYSGRPVMITRNDPALGVFNGDIGLCLPSPSGQLRVYFADGEQLRSVGVARLAHIETAFAMTVHKSQGSEFAHTALVLSASAGSVLGRELVYTGITRAKARFSLFAQRPGLLAQACAHPTQRSSGLLRFLAGEFLT